MIRKPRVLVIDNDCDTLHLITHLVNREHVAVPVSTRQEALPHIGGVNAILMDGGTEALSPLDFMQRVHVTRPRLPVLIVTANRDLLHAAAQLDHDCLRKPFEPQTLLNRVREIVAREQ